MEPDKTILHEADVKEVIDDEVSKDLQDASTQVAIPNLAVATATYDETQQNEIRTTLNSMLGVLRDAGLIPST